MPIHCTRFDSTLHAHVPWDQVVSQTFSLKNDVLKEACRCLVEQVPGAKALFVLRLLQYFSIERPCAVPAIVLLAVKQEKKTSYTATQLNQFPASELVSAVLLSFYHFTHTDINFETTMFAVRKVLASRFASITQLLQYASRFAGPQVSHTDIKKGQ